MVDQNRRITGFTIVELMVSAALMGIVLMYVMQSFSTQQRTYVMVDQVTEAQQNLRAISELVERDVRLAGFMVDEAGAVCGLDSTNGPDTLFVSDASALDPATAILPALGARIPGSSPVSGGQALSGGDTVVLDGAAAYDTDNNGVNDSDFRVGAGAIIYDRNDPTRGSACGTVTAVVPNGTSVTVNLVASNLGGVAAGAQLIVVPAHVYQINANAQLLRDGMVLAEDVEDMQVAYFFDADGDGIVDPGENPGSGNAGEVVYVAANRDNSTLREVRLNFVIRTRGGDPTFRQGVFQTTENRVGVPAPTALDPQTRRRVHTTTVRIRNVGNRGLLG